VKRIWVGVTFRWSFPESAPATVVDFGRGVVGGDEEQYWEVIVRGGVERGGESSRLPEVQATTTTTEEGGQRAEDRRSLLLASLPYCLPSFHPLLLVLPWLISGGLEILSSASPPYPKPRGILDLTPEEGSDIIIDDDTPPQSPTEGWLRHALQVLAVSKIQSQDTRLSEDAFTVFAGCSIYLMDLQLDAMVGVSRVIRRTRTVSA
jgi:hypothetical protein